MIKASIIEYIKKNKDSWNNLREDFHANAEPSFKEYETTKKIKNFLLKYGFEIIEFGNTGIVGILKHGNGSNKIALKVSIDGIEEKEESDLAYKSNNNYMHANGNDGHIVMLLGACQYLSETRDFNGTFYAIFSPGQNVNGINKLIENGLFNKIDPQSVFSLRSMPLIQLKEGKVGDLHFYSNENIPSPFVDMFEFKIIGQSSYGSTPENGYDPIVATSAIIMNLQTIISRNISPFSNATITVGSINGGHVANAISKSVSIKLCITSSDQKIREYLLQRMEMMIQNTCNAYNCTFSKENIGSCISAKNDHKENEFAKELAISLFGEEKVYSINESICSDDFSLMLNKKPGALVLINNGSSEDIFSNKFDFNNQAIPFGVCFFIELVERKLC